MKGELGMLTVLTTEFSGYDEAIRWQFSVNGTDDLENETRAVFEASPILYSEVSRSVFSYRTSLMKWISSDSTYLVCSTVRQWREKLVVNITMRSM